MAFGVVSSPRAFLIFRPDLVNNGTINNDAPYVVDLFQSVGLLRLLCLWCLPC